MSREQLELKQFAEKKAYIRHGGGVSVKSAHPLDRMYIPSTRKSDGTFDPLVVNPFENLVLGLGNADRVYQLQQDTRNFVAEAVREEVKRTSFLGYDGNYLPRQEQDILRKGFQSLSTSSISLVESPVLVGEARNQRNRELSGFEKYESASSMQNVMLAVMHASSPEASSRFVEVVYYTLTQFEVAAATAVGIEALKLNKWLAGLKNYIAVVHALANAPGLRDVVVPQPFTEDINELDRKSVDGLAVAVSLDKKVGFVAAFDAKYTKGVFETDQELPRTDVLEEIYEGIDPEIETLFVCPRIFWIGPQEVPNGLLTQAERQEIRQKVRRLKLGEMDVQPEDMEAYLTGRLLYDFWKQGDEQRMDTMRTRIRQYGRQAPEYSKALVSEVERLAKVNGYAHKLRKVR